MNLRPELTLTIDGVDKLIKFPTIGDFMKIESLKQTLSLDKYNQMVESKLASTAFALDVVDMLSTFMVLLPELFTNSGIKNYNDLDFVEGKKLVDLYNNTYLPWYNDIFAKLFPKKETPVPAKEA